MELVIHYCNYCVNKTSHNESTEPRLNRSEQKVNLKALKTHFPDNHLTGRMVARAAEPHLRDLLVDLDPQRLHLDQREHPGVVPLLAHTVVLRVLRPVEQLLPHVGGVHHLHDPLPRCHGERLPVAWSPRR